MPSILWRRLAVSLSAEFNHPNCVLLHQSTASLRLTRCCDLLSDCFLEFYGFSHSMFTESTQMAVICFQIVF